MAPAVRARADDADSLDSTESAPRAQRVSYRLPRAATFAALTLSLIVVGAAATVRAPLTVRTGAIGASPGDLHLPPAYVALAPLCDVFDAFTMLTIGQHAAMLLWALAALVAWRIRRHSGDGMGYGSRRVRESVALLGALGTAVAFYAAGALAPRPMAALVVEDANDVVVDVHSHTDASHDGRPRFDAEANRAWHADAGFHAVYITDHQSYAGAAAGWLANPALAGDGVVLLPGIESRYGGQHVTVLGATAADSLDRGGKLDLGRLAALAGAESTVAPRFVTVLTLPARLDTIPSEVGLAAIELSNGAPRGIAFARRHGDALRQLAATRGAAAVAGSNNHGWGRAARSWTVVRVPGWRAMTPGALDAAIRGAIAREDRGIRIIERRSPQPPRNAAEWLATPALVAWQVAADMSAPERCAWLLWLWVGWAAVTLFGKHRARGWIRPRGRARLRLEPQYE